MKIHKIAHCCLIIEINGKRILTDPGIFSVETHSKLKDIDLILITHEHADHFHVESLAKLVEAMPEVEVIANDAVASILEQKGIRHKMMKHGDKLEHRSYIIEAFGKVHALMHSSIPPVSNVGYLITDPNTNKGMFLPGDALTDIHRPLHALAVPISGPWLKLAEAIDYALELKPKIAFPVHDFGRIPSQHLIPEKVFSANGIEFIKLEENSDLDLK